MIVTLSSKGQLVIPKAIRQALSLEPGSEIDLKLVGNRVILRPVVDTAQADAALDELQGMFRNTDLFGELRREHQLEQERDGRKTDALRS